MNLQESGEMYLETIYVLQQSKGDVRSIDIASELGYSKPSVSRAVGILKMNRLIEVSSSGIITLTKEGRGIATSIYERHNLLSKYFISIGVNEKTATEDACRIEHIISKETFEKLKSDYRNRFGTEIIK